ncbi:MAG: hypothetical protein WCP00_01055 [bacterium]|jgi:hypothetical protein
MGEKLKQNTKIEIAFDPNTEFAFRLLNPDTVELDDRTTDEIYQEDLERSRVETYEIDTKRGRASVLHMSELLIGNQDSAIDTYRNVLEQTSNLDEDTYPDLIVMSGIVQGDFKYFHKSRKETLAPGFSSMAKQFAEARKLLGEARKIAPVIYNMGDDDIRIAKDYTVEVFRRMHQLQKDFVKSNDSDEVPELGLSVSSLDKMKQHPMWNEHYQFQLSTIYPHTLRLGRRLYVGSELSELTDGEINVDEYFLLFEASKRSSEGKPLTNQQKSLMKLIEKEYESLGEDELYDLEITRNFNLSIKTKNAEYLDWIRHYLNQTPEVRPKNHIGTPLGILGLLASRGEAVPDMIVTQNNLETMAISHQDTYAVSVSGLLRTMNYLHRQGSRTDARSDISRKIITGKKQIAEPGAQIHTRTDEGNHIITILNDVQYEKSFSLSERMTIVGLCDLQHGSITARPDLLVKYLDYIRARVIGERTTAIFFGGDMLHGRNYPNFPSESQLTGLMAMDSQEDFTMRIFKEAFGDLTQEELAAVTSVLVQPGNHEWNSGTTKWHGYSFTTYMRSVFEKMFARAGYTDEEISKIVESHEASITNKGEYITGYTGIKYFGDIGVLIQHYLMEKGASSGIPVQQTEGFVKGLGELARNLDVFMQGHWHHPQLLVTGSKIGVGMGSIAGMSDFELKRGLRSTIAGTLIHIGGGQPPQVEFISHEALLNRVVKTGNFKSRALKKEGFFDDEGFDPVRHGLYIPGAPKSAIQKKVLAEQRDASERVGRISEFR